MRADEDQSEPLVPAGNAVRPWSLALAGFGLVLLLAVMAREGHGALGLPFGLVALALAVFGLLDGLGTFDAAHAGPVIDARKLAKPLGALCLSIAFLIVSLRAAVAGSLPWPRTSAGLLVTLGCVGFVASAFETLRALGRRSEAEGDARPCFASPGFWLVVLCIVLYVPLLGSYSLVDPWETHYGEVAREMLARDDWISLWWAQENWFWSKPVLDFWIQGISFLLLGVRYLPDQMLSAAADGAAPAPEWAARLPGIGLTLVATYLAYRALSQIAGRRAGFLGGLVLASTPYWALIAHQSMTDMPYVAPLTSALCLIVLGLEAPAEEPAPRYGVRIAKRTFWISISHVVLGLVLATSLPQLVYLVSRNVTLGQVGAGLRFALRRDQFIAGSGGGNCGLPGNEECRAEFPMNDAFQPALGALIWAVALALLLFANRGERRLSRWYFLGAWYFVALSALAKGAPGLFLPLVITLVAVAATKRFEAFARLELPSFVLLFACVTLPWYVQAFMRHGSAFTDRLLFYDMYKRAFVHVHDTNAGDDVSFRYYLWQLGYGLFPVSGFALWGFIGSFAGDDEAHSERRRGEAFLALWAVLGFAMFSVSLTKFHHYALPVAPPLALLAGLELNRMLGPASRPRPPLGALVAYALAALAALLGALALTPGSLFGTLSAHAPASPLVGCLLLGAAIAATALAVRAFPSSTLSAEPAARFDAARGGLVALCCAGVCFLVGRDLFTNGAVEGPMRILNLFSYNYARSWPPSLDFEAAFRAFTLVGCVLLALGVVVRLRPHVSLVFVALGVWFSAFLLDIYLLRVAPHWGQRETMLAYYTTRAGPEEPLVAYQMNWKGENFYTGNRVATFVSSGQKFKEWLADQRADGTRVLYVTTEHSRVGVLKSELGAVRRFQILTTPELNNKFFLARVEL